MKHCLTPQSPNQPLNKWVFDLLRVRLDVFMVSHRVNYLTPAVYVFRFGLAAVAASGFTYLITPDQRKIKRYAAQQALHHKHPTPA